jgi:hypothetical protein
MENERTQTKARAQHPQPNTHAMITQRTLANLQLHQPPPPFAFLVVIFLFFVGFGASSTTSVPLKPTFLYDVVLQFTSLL